MQKTTRQSINAPHHVSHHLDKLAIPYLIWLIIFAILPSLFMIFLMFVDTEGTSFEGLTGSITNFQVLAEKSTLVAFFNSLKFSLITTAICVFFGFLIAYSLHRSKLKNKYLILLLLILPMWTNFLLRINALASVFKTNNILSSILGFDFPNIIGSDFAIILGMTFTYLPFMIMPIYTSLEKIDPLIDEAAFDLGFTEFKRFWKVTVPMARAGVVSGIIMVLLPCLSGFAIPKVLGDGNVILIGNIIEQKFTNMNYNEGAVLAVGMLIIIIGSIIIINKNDKEGDTLI